MSYTPPAYNAVNFSWVGATAYTPPAHNAVNFTWANAVTGVGAGVVQISGAAAGHAGDLVTGVGEGVIPITGAATGSGGISGAGAGVVGFSGEATADYGPFGAGAGVVRIGGSGVAQHTRYELVGVVKLGGVLVNRRVRAYLRSSGALVAEADTVGGAFRLPVGFVEDEFYVTPIDLSPSATDWKPPTANRVTSVLAVDP